MKSKYGIPEQTKQLKGEQTIYRWKYKDTKIKLKLNSSENTMKLAFYYTPLSKKVNEAQQEKFQKKSFKFFPIDKNKTPEFMPLLQF
jgi:nitrate reductase beta subunit